MWGRTRELYRDRRILCGRKDRNFFIIPTALDILLPILVLCGHQETVSSTVTPKKLKVSVCWIGWLSMERVSGGKFWVGYCTKPSVQFH